MVQDLPARVPAQAGVWVEDRGKAEAEWADLLQQAQVVVAFARTAGTRQLMLLDSLVMQ